MKHKNFFLINGSGENVKCYIIDAHEDELHFWRYEKGVKYPVCSISDIGNRLLYFAVDEKQDFQMAVIEYPSVIIRKPDGKRLPIHQKHQLEFTTKNRNIFIVHNKSYPDLPVSNATIYFKKEKDKELRLLASVYIEDTMATIMIQSGADIKTVSTKLGHRSIEITLSLYCHSNKDAQQAANEKFASLVWNG